MTISTTRLGVLLGVMSMNIVFGGVLLGVVGVLSLMQGRVR